MRVFTFSILFVKMHTLAYLIFGWNVWNNYVFNNHWRFYPRDATLARVLAVVCVWLSLQVCVSVTRRYCIETAARIELIFCVQVSLNLCYAIFLGNYGTCKNKISPRHADRRRVRYKQRQRSAWCWQHLVATAVVRGTWDLQPTWSRCACSSRYTARWSIGREQPRRADPIGVNWYACTCCSNPAYSGAFV